MPHMTCGSATFYSFRSAHRLRIREQNNLRTVLEPQFFPAPVTKYKYNGHKNKKIIPGSASCAGSGHSSAIFTHEYIQHIWAVLP
jgi:hypothetical protein